MSDFIEQMSGASVAALGTPEVVEAPIVEQAANTENAEPNIETVDTKTEKTFTQSELDGIVTKRIERERETTAKRVAQESRDAYVAEQGYEWQGKRIATEAEYKQAMKEVEIRKQYENQDLPDEILDEIVEGKKFRAEVEPQLAQIRTEKKQMADFKALFEAYPDLDANTVPQSVWIDYNNGRDLVDAYARHENASLKQRLAEIEQKQQIEQLNQANANSSTGSVTGNGSAAPSFFTLQQVQNMSQADVDKNYKVIMESQKKWYK